HPRPARCFGGVDVGGAENQRGHHEAGRHPDLDVSGVLLASREREQQHGRPSRGPATAPHPSLPPHVPGCGGVIVLMKLLSMSEASWICFARSRTTLSASSPCRISISSAT